MEKLTNKKIAYLLVDKGTIFKSIAKKLKRERIVETIEEGFMLYKKIIKKETGLKYYEEPEEKDSR